MNEYPLVVITWLDHTGDANWKSKAEIEKSKPALATSIGWLIHEDRETIKICNTFLDDGTLGGEDLILKSCVKSRQEYELEQ